jgi:hypothetical protein
MLGNAHAASNTGALFYVARGTTIAMLRAIHAVNNSGAVFSVLRGLCRRRQFEGTRESRKWEYNGVQRITTE